MNYEIRETKESRIRKSPGTGDIHDNFFARFVYFVVSPSGDDLDCAGFGICRAVGPAIGR
jgi:hypothetical protein